MEDMSESVRTQRNIVQQLEADVIKMEKEFGKMPDQIQLALRKFKPT
jgi:hypothetical protein